LRSNEINALLTDGFAFSCLSASPSLRQAQVSLPIGTTLAR
jgi:hypothetical protein